MKNKKKYTKESLRPTWSDWKKIMMTEKQAEGTRETQQVLREVRNGIL